MKPYQQILGLAVMISLMLIPLMVEPKIETKAAKPDIHDCVLRAHHQPPQPILETQTYASVTGYSELETCPYSRCITASGKKARVGLAACPTWIPFGTKFKVVDLPDWAPEWYECADRTHPRYNGRYDLFMGYNKEGYQKAVQWGLRRKKIEIYR